MGNLYRFVEPVVLLLKRKGGPTAMTWPLIWTSTP
jgi:hypothetical protein